ncbi:transglycosylase SLT domain-containing protein [Pasteurella multocida]|uniref:transglycosylase SLT domain-containing protein n=1 Tax=Pasteurella multocida TaxID=747 RepID=UPI002BED7D3D|nr:transglycosylase SLT domain-containing protein [Pasteurella multocida]MEB3470142.1 transglycosylase SLT domain-containing protein [Pasteurella multocida]
MRIVHHTHPIFRRVAMFLLALLVASCLCVATAFAAIPPQAKQYQRELTRNSHLVWGLNAPVALFAAQVHQESQWKLNARSPVGAQGLAQFMPQTAKWISQIRPELAANEPFNPSWALRALVELNRFNYQRITAASECDRLAFMLSAYNGGLGWVQKDKRFAKTKGLDPLRYWEHVEKVNSGRSAANFKENRGYPQRIIYRWQPEYVEANWGKGACL